MNEDQVLALLRTILTSLGSVVAAHGWFTAADYNTLVGAAMILVSAGWTLWANKVTRKKLLETPPPAK